MSEPEFGASHPGRVSSFTALLLKYPGAPDIVIDHQGKWVINGKATSDPRDCVEAIDDLVAAWREFTGETTDQFDEVVFLRTMGSQ